MSATKEAVIQAEAWGFDLDDPRTSPRYTAVCVGRDAILASWNEWPADAERKALTVVRGLIREGLI